MDVAQAAVSAMASLVAKVRAWLTAWDVASAAVSVMASVVAKAKACQPMSGRVMGLASRLVLGMAAKRDWLLVLRAVRARGWQLDSHAVTRTDWPRDWLEVRVRG